MRISGWSSDVCSSDLSGFDGCVSGVSEVVVAFAWFDGGDEVADVAPGLLDGSLLCCSHPVLDLGEGLLDGVEVGRVRRQEPEPGAGGADHMQDGDRLVGAAIVHDADVAGFEQIGRASCRELVCKSVSN